MPTDRKSLCIHCEAEFHAKNPKRAFCSNACRQASYRERTSAKPKKPKPMYPGMTHSEAWAAHMAKLPTK